MSNDASAFKSMVYAHWDNVVGNEARVEKFETVGAEYQAYYLSHIKLNGNLPNTSEIESYYGTAVSRNGLPASTAIDLVINDAFVDDATLGLRK